MLSVLTVCWTVLLVSHSWVSYRQDLARAMFANPAVTKQIAEAQEREEVR